MPTVLTKYQVAKIGNTISYLGAAVSELSKTKLLKVLFLIEEKSIKEYGIPFFGIDFKIWQFGPVGMPMWESLNDVGNNFLSTYVLKNKFDEYEGKAPFVDDEFSNNDISVLEWVVGYVRHKTADDLVKITHSKDSLWRKGAIKYGVYDKFEKEGLRITDYSIDFSILFENHPKSHLLEKYNSAIENMELTKNYKETISV